MKLVPGSQGYNAQCLFVNVPLSIPIQEPQTAKSLKVGLPLTSISLLEPSGLRKASLLATRSAWSKPHGERSCRSHTSSTEQGHSYDPSGWWIEVGVTAKPWRKAQNPPSNSHTWEAVM